MGNLLLCPRSKTPERKIKKKSKNKNNENEDSNYELNTYSDNDKDIGKKGHKKLRRKSSDDLPNYVENDMSRMKMHKNGNKSPKVTLIGLSNIGATCYMNSTLQCLSNTEELTKFFLNDYFYIKEDTTKKISNQYYLLLKKLWIPQSKKKFYEPYDFKNLLSVENPLFAGVNACDSKDLLNFLLERIHIELNTKVTKVENQENFNFYENIQMNEEEIKKLFFEDFQNNYRSIISDLFYFTIETKTKCSQCNCFKYNFQVHFFIEFPLEEVNKYLFMNNKIMSLKNMDGSNPDIDILDCFEYYHKVDLMTGDNQMYCSICRNSFDAFYQTSLYILPNYLIINLNRGKNAVYQCKVIFPEILTLSQYVSYKDINTIFEVYAVICHIGPSSMDGHFVAYCKNRLDHQWYLYNDSIVSLCGSPNEYIKHMPYILFYKSKNSK